MTKVKLFAADSVVTLEENINYFLESEVEQVIGINYSTSAAAIPDGYGRAEAYCNFSALVHYEAKKADDNEKTGVAVEHVFS
ncbi:sporulation protein Cse60 [Paenibacillus camerounensis]|uniref:sporulation protein Cse60 n=1 Tax=Paenibacillus camerounensis TaxID=1243663 RepID=UPI0005A5F412|nr:sporulation protein Cse60 [Paenibacillus camerounensis]